ncbi:MAG: exostosin family protein [Planctomycetaceae bacterium]|nr:exostosin family protein [Planctomycetaceae bacterium]
MFVHFSDPPAHARLVDATLMPGAQRLVAQGWDVCSSYLDGYVGVSTPEARQTFAGEVARAVAALPERCVVLTAGVPLQQCDPWRLVCNNSAIRGTGAVAIPYWFDDQSHPAPFSARTYLAGFQGTVSSNPPLRGRVVAGFAGCERSYCGVNQHYFYSLTPEERGPLVRSYWDQLSQTQFALCPRGDNCGSLRFYEALAAGCIPVLLADGAELPLADVLPWDDMIVRVPEAEAANWQDHVARWRVQRTDGDLASQSQYNRQTWCDWLHWSQLGKQLSVEWGARAIAAAER